MKILIVKDPKKNSECARAEDIFHEHFMEESAFFIKEALKIHHDVSILEADTLLREHLLNERPDLVFNLVNGEELPGGITHVPNLLDEIGIPYTGSSGAAHLRAYDKGITMRFLKCMGIQVPRFKEVRSLKDMPAASLPFPVLIKPMDGGYSRGIFNENLVFTPDELYLRVEKLFLEKYAPLLLTEFIQGRELTLGVLGSGEHLCVLPPMEVSFENLPENLHRFYSYEAKVTYEKYIQNSIPAKVSKDLSDQLEVTARHIFRTLGLSDYARLDLRIKEDNRIYLIEANSLPGLHKTHSDLVKMNEALGRTYEDLISSIIASACKRQGESVSGRLISGR